MPGARESLRWTMPDPSSVHPVPEIENRLSPGGGMAWITCTLTPLKGPASAAFETAIV